MSPKPYADEDAIAAQLEKLLSVETARQTSPTTGATTNQLLTSHHLANEHLSTTDITLPPLPSPENTHQCTDLLSTAFDAIIRLSQCATANKNLREASETTLRHSTRRVEELSKSLLLAEERVKKRDSVIATLRNAENDMVSKHRLQLRRISAEATQLKSRLLHAGHRENQLILAGKKREKEFAQLQSRVHALFKSSVAIEQRITRVGTRVSPRCEDSLEAHVENLGEDRIVAVERENDVLRGLLQAVQEELDDLILSHGPQGSDVSDEFDVPPAPGDDVMALPMDVIGGDLQDCLEKKFGILRTVLQGEVHGEYANDAGVEEIDHQFDDRDDGRDDGGEEERRVQDDVSADSAHRSVDLMSGKVADYRDADAGPVDAETGPVYTNAETVGAGTELGDADVDLVSADAKTVGAEAELFNGFAEPVNAHVDRTDGGSAPLHTKADIDAEADAQTIGSNDDATDDMHEKLQSKFHGLSIAELTNDAHPTAQ